MDEAPGDGPGRMDRNEARKLVSRLLVEGKFGLPRHCLKEAANDGLNSIDVVNILRAASITEEPEQVRGRWRYRLHTPRFCVVVEFRSLDEFTAVTVWRKRP